MPDLLNQRLPIPAEIAGACDDITAFDREESIRLKRLGWTTRDIAKHLSVSEDTARRHIRHAVEAARASEREMILERFHMQDQRLEYLIRKIFEKLEAMVDFDERLVRSEILVCDRQAKLLGLDKTKTAASSDWLESASQDDLVRMAKARGISLPEKFTCS